MAATNQQIQTFVDSRIRAHAKLARDLAILLTDDIANIDDVYNQLNGGNSGNWADTRTDGPAHLMSASDVLALNSFFHNVRDAITADGQYAIALKACITPPNV